MPIKKYTDWRTWWDGLRTNLMKCLGTTGSAWLITNGVSATGIPGTAVLAIAWQSALAFFLCHLAKEVFDYMAKNQPVVITEEVETTHFAKDAAGNVSGGSSKTTTTTPVETTPKNEN